MRLVTALAYGLLAVSIGWARAGDAPPGNRAGSPAEPSVDDRAPWKMRAWAEDLRPLADALAAEGQPRQLALAARIRQWAFWTDAFASMPQSSPIPNVGWNDPRIVAWRASADMRAGKDPVANAILAGMAAEAGDPQAQRAAAQRWENAEPDNLAPLFFGGAPPEQVLAAVHARHRFDAHWIEQMRWSSSAIAPHAQLFGPQSHAQGGTRYTDADLADATAFEMISIQAIPDFHPVLQACRDKALDATPTRRADCLALGHALRETSDLATAQLTGNALLRHAATDAAALAEAHAYQRRLEWQMTQDSVAIGTDQSKALDQLHSLLHDPSIHTEQEGFAHHLAAAHIPLDPPADWQLSH